MDDDDRKKPEEENPLNFMFPPIPAGTTYVRTNCGEFYHWWWPKPKRGDRCMCGERRWKWRLRPVDS